MKNIICVLFACALFLVACEDDSVKNAEMPPSDHQQEAVNEVRDCPDIMKYKVGEHVFGIPRGSHVSPLLLKPADAQFPCNEVVELKRLRYNITKFLEHDRTNDQGVIATFSIQPKTDTERKKPEKPSGYLAKGTAKYLGLEDVSMQDLPLENGFYKFKHLKDHFLLIPNKETEVKYKDLHFIGCRPDVYSPHDLMCNIRFDWQDNLVVGISFSAVKFPLIEWSRVFEGAQIYLEELRVKEIDMKD